MYGQIGSWDEGLTVALGAQALTWLDAQGTERVISIVTEDRRVLVCPDDTSDPSVRRKVAYRGRGAHVDYQHSATFDWPIVQGFDLPRFSLFEVKLHSNGYYLWIDLPADHMLPWPKLRECASYDMPTQIVADLERRMRSAKAAFADLPPAKWTWVPMPEKYRRMLAQGVYGNCLKAVLADRTYAEAA